MKEKERHIGIIICCLFAALGAAFFGFLGLLIMGFEGDGPSGPKFGVLWPLGGILLGGSPGIGLLWFVRRSPEE